jgi:glycosyltransferase involved in cell wall biosynthesis
VHGDILQQLDRSRFKAYAACPVDRSNPTPTLQLLDEIPDLEICPIDLGREVSGQCGWARLRNIASAVRAIAGLARLTSLIWRQGIAVVHSTDRPRDAFTCVLLSRITPARSLVHLHVAYAGWMSRMRKWSLKHADAVVTVSDFVKQTLVDSGHDPDKIYSVRNGIDVGGLARADRSGPLREELGIPAAAPVILTVCRLFPGKGPGDLIAALLGLVQDWPDVRLVIVGVEMERGYQAKLEQQARDSDVQPNVIFTGWRSDVADIMAASDVFAMPSLGEPLGLVYLEAMATGLPVVALTSGGAPEVVEDGWTGFLCAPGDMAMLESSLRALLCSPETRVAMGCRGRHQVEAHFTAERMARDIELLYEGITA